MDRERRKRMYMVEETLQLFQDKSQVESGGGEVSDFSNEDWVGDDSSDSELESLQEKTKRSADSDTAVR